MDAQTIWLLVLSIATPMAGVVGFAIQLRQVKKAQLENEKLQLEIAALRQANERRSQVIQVATTEEVIRFTREDKGAFARGPCPWPEEGPRESASSLRSRISGFLLATSVAALVLAFVAYALYDLYRIIRWLANAL